MSEDGANTFSLAPVNENKGIQGANINNSHVENLTINIMGRSFEKRKIIIGASILILILVLGIVGISLIVHATSTSATSSSSVSDLEGKFFTICFFRNSLALLPMIVLPKRTCKKMWNFIFHSDVSAKNKIFNFAKPRHTALVYQILYCRCSHHWWFLFYYPG